MDSQKGSLKDRLRSWSLFLKYKLKIQKKKKEEKRRNKIKEKELKKKAQLMATGKYYSKPRIFALTLAGLFLGIFENKVDKQDKITSVEEKISLLEIKISSLSSEQYNNLASNIKSEITKLKALNRFDDDIKLKLDACENKINDITVKRTSENNYDYKQQANYNHKNKGIYTPVLEIKVINKELKDYDKKLKELDNKIKETYEYSYLYELEFSLKQLKLKFNDLLNKYNNLKELPGFSNLENIFNVENIDIYDLRKDSKKIEMQIIKCDAYLANIEDKKKSILDKNKENKINNNQASDEKKTENNTKEEKEKKEVDDKILEIKLANRIILDRLANEKRNIEKFKRNLGKVSVKKRKRSIFYYTKNMLSSIFNFGLSLFPISLFKNKFIGGLTSGIMMNNSLRSVKKVLMPEVDTIYILYSDFEKDLNDTNDYLNGINYVCNDSLNQINAIRNIIYAQYSNELEYSDLLSDYLKDLDGIESQILSQQEMILGLQTQVQITKEKNKQKIKQWAK